ncbi:Pyruvate kinase [Phytophthora fragariae]|uniref:Pyruvate kinase n=1 Tax=Phytophthora fragariae TaxID=53985 RepID=A0A6A4A0V3_9STRA|nr:Pyruvate kinase [Phytophthora fragariae]KAE9247044.1 Pyruvate kinase [Phytophthora fragariae]KAE9355291.1 Pyruvate kinase [Phytophthora fragariae]
MSERHGSARNPRTGTVMHSLPRRRSKDDELMRTPSSAYDQLRVSGFPPVRLGSWHRYRSLSQEFDDVFKPESSSIARKPANFHVGIELKQIMTPTTARARKTKIICAIGPASWSVEMLGQLLDAGMNVARCAVLAGQTLEITTDYGVEGDSSRIACTYEQLPTSVSVGSKILCDDGSLVMTVIECRPESIVVRVHNDHLLEEKKNMNLPGAAIQIPGITEKDEDDLLNFAIPNGVDIVSGSFVRSAANVRAIRECLGEDGRHIRVHAKIESQEALQNIDEIIAEADGIHVSRGDLGMELSPERVFLAQKMIIGKANRAGKPVVTSTQMLQSMTKKIIPSNAECTDVANAVLDGTDAMMLSAETAKGMYPKEAVATMAKICIEAEQALDYAEVYRLHRAANNKNVSMYSGDSTKLLAKYRPKANIVAVTSSTLTARQLSGVSRGVTALLVDSMTDVDDLTLQAIAFAKERGLIKSGDVVILVHGLDDAVSKSTNVVKVIEVDKQSCSSYSSPKHSFFSGIHIPFT